MSTDAAGSRQIAAVGAAVLDLLDEFTLHLRAQNKSPATINGYAAAVAQSAAFVADRRLPAQVGHIRRRPVQASVAEVLAEPDRAA